MSSVTEEVAVKEPIVGTPVTVFTGYLGAGKTSIILSLIRNLPAGYKCVWLKNEFGDMEVDSEMAKESNIAVKEIVNGCLCCVLVGQLGNALEELIQTQNPDRIIIETSGSAYPAPLAWELRKYKPMIHLDGIITVIDAVNFPGYDDKSYTAKEQCKYTDLILINKHELSPDERTLDKLLDDVHELNPETPKVRTKGPKGEVSADLVFGIDTKLFSDAGEVQLAMSQHQHDSDHQALEVDLLQAKPGADYIMEQSEFEEALRSLPTESVFRSKGIVPLICDGVQKTMLFNCVAGRVTLDEIFNYKGAPKMILMGEEFFRLKKKIIAALKLPAECVKLTVRGTCQVDGCKDDHSHGHGHGHSH
mmetsp:Transcript_499/g.874  ORF Transcript_499/g.874 Transcript_499/m.874 type:complete len:362 (-) Transcript_499:178-1263(-)|eukprot:CAMPEP_0198199322 /NCGR_PEP_ID=MMETSP1445-20131203/2637_1 /TAXON_ID=36898 /ORGANISM="Pyramimonas sp., Strain CCMP2087" /LENGTH=361 /DNA_ID=CAMNT_0043869139 /DNA_START=223 /DNA_END=1308 /DNA_ORIENTATION=+